MDSFSYRAILWLFLLFSSYSCTLPNGVSIGPTGNNGEETITLTLNTVSLKFDFGKKLNTAFISGDYFEFINYHNVAYNDDYSGAITCLNNILWREEDFDESHKPSITVTLEDNLGKIEHKCKKEDISWNTVFGIPNPNHLYKGTVEVKSIKTGNNGIQVVWKKTATDDNWPINEFIADGSISCDMPYIIKVGTNNNNGDVAGRGGFIIDNTSDSIIVDLDGYSIKEVQLLSPDLRKQVIVNGEVSSSVKWLEPVIYQAR